MTRAIHPNASSVLTGMIYGRETLSMALPSTWGRLTQTYFSCLIDDATQYILHGEFYENMEQGIMEDTLQKAMTKFGLPRRLYFGDGTQYRTHRMKRACGLLDIRLLYAKPGNPQGKGKQERFIQTLDAFLAGAALHPPERLQELNTQFNAWLSECYHSRPHGALGTPRRLLLSLTSCLPVLWTKRSWQGLSSAAKPARQTKAA